VPESTPSLDLGGPTAVHDTVPTLALLGAHGHGTTHLRRLRGLVSSGGVRLVAVVDPRPLATPDDAAAALADGMRLATTDDVPAGTDWFPDLDTLLADRTPDVVLVSTPIDTHALLTRTALEAGCDVLLEKPPTASLDELTGLLDTQRATGRAVQVGFQSFGSHALARVRQIVDGGEIGTVTGIGGVGTWARPRTYWTRARWAGHRTLDGRTIADGVVTNPLAHAVATALLLADATRAQDVTGVELDLAHANPIEADDTSSVRITTASGLRIALGLTLCAPTSTLPSLVVHGTRGRVVLRYTTDELEVRSPQGHRTEIYGRDDLLENLLAHRADPSVRLLAPLASTGAFMHVLDAVSAAPAPVAIDASHVDVAHGDDGEHLVVRGVEELCEHVADTLSTFRELGAPWTTDAGGPA
jgi:predicted dehydrogenase